MTPRKKQSALDAMLATTEQMRRVTVCTDGEAAGRYYALLAKLPEATVKEMSLAQESVTALVDEMEKDRGAIEASQVTFTFIGLNWVDRAELQAQHPPRDGSLADRVLSYNASTFLPALLKASFRSAVGADGVLMTELPDEAWDTMLAKINSQDSENLRQAATAANDQGSLVPPSARSWLGSQDSGASSKSPGPGTSPRSASKAGSRPTSRKSTATKKAASSG